MQSIKRFLNLNEVYKDTAKKLEPFLSKRDDFEAAYQYQLPCPSCGEESASGLFFRFLDQEDWLQAGKTMNCSTCRDQEAFEVYRNKSLSQLRESIKDRLSTEYFQIPVLLKNAGFKNYEETNKATMAAKGKAILYAKDFLKGDKYNLLVMGSPGTGKTHLCSAIARTVKEAGYIVGFLTTGKVLSMIKETYQKGAAKSEAETFRDLKKLDLLILDDLGSEAIGGNNDWRLGMIFEIVESRSGKPTIYTSNLTDEDLAKAVGSRVFSRLYDNTKFIDLFTDDYRKTLKRT